MPGESPYSTVAVREMLHLHSAGASRKPAVHRTRDFVRAADTKRSAPVDHLPFYLSC
jgi:hypothetical protein